MLYFSINTQKLLQKLQIFLNASIQSLVITDLKVFVAYML